MTSRQRGQPLIFLAMIVVLWIGARMVAWGWPSPATQPVVSAGRALPGSHLSSPGVSAANPFLAAAASRSPLVSTAERPVMRHRLRPAIVVGPATTSVALELADGQMTITKEKGLEGLAANTRLAQPFTIANPSAQSAPSRGSERRWSADAWALVRHGGGTSSIGPGVATYGGSQVGGVLRYRLAPGNAHRPTAYFRVSAALNGVGESEAAIGLSARPVAGVPIFIAAEGRVGVLAGRTVTRPAIMAVTEVPPLAMPGKTRAEFYAQAGYVGGTGATPFADGQLRVDKRMLQAGPLELRAGAGAWGGAQRGAARFDVGPSVTMGVTKGTAAARVALDWRFRIAGTAEPASGPALTISAGF